MNYDISSKKKYGISPCKYLFLFAFFICLFFAFLFIKRFTSPSSNVDNNPAQTSQNTTPEPKTTTSISTFIFRPIYLKNFQTSVGIETSINVFKVQSDPENTIRIDITGIDYGQSSPGAENPQYAAFSESLQKAYEEVWFRSIDPYGLNVLFYSAGKINPVADDWAKKEGYKL